MKVLLTGGTGFIGARLARALLDRGVLTGVTGEEEAIDELVLFDSVEGPGLSEEKAGGIVVRRVVGDISDQETVQGLLDRDDLSVFHLAAVPSTLAAEMDFDLAMRVNLDGSRHLLEGLRAREGLQRLVFLSSIAVFGGAGMPRCVGDLVKQTPQSTYGITKAVLELLINDYTRKGFLDGRSARLPSVIIRPEKMKLQSSGFINGVFREPLNGEDFELPVPLDTVTQVLGYRAIVQNLIRLHEVDGDRLSEDRAVGFPCHTVTFQEMIDALQAARGNRRLGKITVKPDPVLTKAFQMGPQDCETARATELGLQKEANLEEIVRDYIDDYLEGER
jgi:nucleoside-diphosphate-sugar epimerase